MDMHVVQGNECALDRTLEHIAADDHGQQKPLEFGLNRAAVGGKALRPGPPPEGRVDEVDAMIERSAQT